MTHILVAISARNKQSASTLNSTTPRSSFRFFFNTMQRCLQIAEIVDTIVRRVDQGLVNVALTSHLFYEPAMDVVWRELNGIEPLVRLLPETVLDENDGGPLVCVTFHMAIL